MDSSQAKFFRLAALLGGLAVVFGAFAAHGLKAKLSSESLSTFEVGVRYQMYHAIAMLAVASATALWTSPWTGRACGAWLIGVAIFSGSLYVLALTDIKWLGAVTPFGGVAMILGWLFLIIAGNSLRNKSLN